MEGASSHFSVVTVKTAVGLDRNRYGGGILIFLHDSLVSKVVVAGPSSLELLIISVSNHVNTCKHHL